MISYSYYRIEYCPTEASADAHMMFRLLLPQTWSPKIETIEYFLDTEDGSTVTCDTTKRETQAVFNLGHIIVSLMRNILFWYKMKWSWSHIDAKKRKRKNHLWLLGFLGHAITLSGLQIHKLWKCQVDQLLRQPVGTIQTCYFSTPEGHSVMSDVPQRMDLPSMKLLLIQLFSTLKLPLQQSQIKLHYLTLEKIILLKIEKNYLVEDLSESKPVTEDYLQYLSRKYWTLIHVHCNPVKLQLHDRIWTAIANPYSIS